MYSKLNITQEKSMEQPVPVRFFFALCECSMIYVLVYDFIQIIEFDNLFIVSGRLVRVVFSFHSLFMETLSNYLIFGT